MRQSRLEDAGMPWVVLRFALILVALSVSPAPHALAQDKPWRIGFLSEGLPAAGRGEFNWDSVPPSTAGSRPPISPVPVRNGTSPH